MPPIIDPETFDAVQKLLKARNPKVMPSRVISGPTMLTGLIHCAKCGGAMTIRTGKGAMPGFFGVLREREILDVVAYLRTLS